MEYGWQKVLPSMSGDVPSHEDDRASVMSGRSGMSKLGGTYGRKGFGLPGERMHIKDWKPPIPAGIPSPLDEEGQLEALQVYVKSLRSELDEHKAVEEPMHRQVSMPSLFCVACLKSWQQPADIAVLTGLEELAQSSRKLEI